LPSTRILGRSDNTTVLRLTMISGDKYYTQDSEEFSIVDKALGYMYA
jgi:hypothetical protein